MDACKMLKKKGMGEVKEGERGNGSVEERKGEEEKKGGLKTIVWLLEVHV